MSYNLVKEVYVLIDDWDTLDEHLFVSIQLSIKGFSKHKAILVLKTHNVMKG